MIYFFPIIWAAYVGLIYIHGYPDNEAFNPGDPAVRTMNPITSCRLRYGMADSETDGRDCGRPAIQSHLSHSPVRPSRNTPPHQTFLRSCSRRNLSTGQGQRTGNGVSNRPPLRRQTPTATQISGQPSFASIRLTCSGFTCTSGTIQTYLTFFSSAK